MNLQSLFYSALKKYCRRASNENSSPKVLNQIKVGDEAIITKTITDNDILAFAKITGDYNPIHIEQERKLVHGALLNGLLSGVIGTKLPGPGTVVIDQHLSFVNPCYGGDIVEIKVQITSVRKIIKCEYTCTANGETVVLKGNAKLIKKS